MTCACSVCVFFFQAEDGIRDFHVTGVQTCALPIFGADLCVPFGVTDRVRVEQSHVERLEQLCDELNAVLPPLKSFVLPGGTEAAARLHVARTTCRRAEREAIAANEEHGVNPLVLAYLNRLSDFLFIAARSANAAAGREEPLWLPGG